MTTPGTSKAEIDKNTYGIIDLRKGDPTYGYELSQAVEDGVLPDQIESAALNKWVFNEDTIRKALDTLMSQGIRVDYGNKLSLSLEKYNPYEPMYCAPTKIFLALLKRLLKNSVIAFII